MSPDLTLPAVLRSGLGRDVPAAASGSDRALSARAVRRVGYVPAVVYGHGVDNLSLAVEQRALQKLLPSVSPSTLLTLTIQGAEPRRVLIQDVQRDPLTGDPTHVDFHQVRLTEKIRARVPLRATGISAAVKDLGGVFVQSLDEIEVEALPQDLPSEIAFDLGKLRTFEDRVTVADLPAVQGVAFHVKPDEIVAVVQPPRTEEELKELEKPTEAPAAAEVKTEAEVKKATEEAEKAKEGEPPAEKKPEAKKPERGEKK